MKEKREVLGTLFLILQVGITMLVTFGLCFAIGFFLDKQFGTKLLWVFIVLGILSGYRAVYLLIRHHIRDSSGGKDKPEWFDRAFQDELSHGDGTDERTIAETGRESDKSDESDRSDI